MSEVIDVMMAGLTTAHEEQLSSRIIYLVVFTIGINIFFVAICYRYLRAISEFVERSRTMLSIIPVDCIILCKMFDRLVLQYLKR